MDNVNHPKHYEGKYECIEEMISDLGVDYVQHFCLGNAYKYLWRCMKKNGYEDIRKANWYIHKYFELGATPTVSNYWDRINYIIFDSEDASIKNQNGSFKKDMIEYTSIDLLLDIYGKDVVVSYLIIKAMCRMKLEQYEVVGYILETIISIIDQEES